MRKARMPLDKEKRRLWTNNYWKQVRQWRREHHICTLCGKQDAAIGFVRCSDCQQKQAERDDRYKQTKSNSDKRRYERRKEAGVCTVCGSAIDGPHKLCEKCHKKKLERTRKIRARKHIAPVRKEGFCVLCGEKAVDGKKLCQKHYDSACANLVLARAAINRETHFWHIREDNFHRNRERAKQHGNL